MTEHQIGRLLVDLWADLHKPSVLWQVGVLALCLALAWWLSRMLSWRAPDDSREAVKRGAAVFRRVEGPLLAMLLLIAGRAALAPWHSTHLLSVAIPLVGALAGIRFAVYLLRIVFPQAAWMDAFERSIAAAVWVVIALHLTGLLPEVIDWLEAFELSFGKLKLSLWVVLSAMFWIGVTLLLALWAGAALEARLMRAASLHSSLRVAVARLTRSLLVIAALLVVLPLAGVDLTVLSVFGGALGVGLGFGLQKVFSNYVSGFIILLDRSIRLGDIITADNQTGEVTRITTRYVVVRTLTGIEAIIPNDSLVTTTVLNHSYSDRRVRQAVRVQVAYGTNLREAFALMLAIARAHPRVLKEPEPTAQVLEMVDSGVNLELGVWIADPEAGSQNLRSDLSVAILEKFGMQGIEIPYPRHDVRVLQGSSAGAGGHASGT